MSTILCVYRDEPNFPAVDQHPQAKRYAVRSAFLGRPVSVDALDGEPTSEDVDAVLNPPRSLAALRGDALKAWEEACLAAAAQGPNACAEVKSYAEACAKAGK